MTKPVNAMNKLELREDRDFWLQMYETCKREKELLTFETFKIEFEKLNAKPGDTLVIKTPAGMQINQETAKRLKAYFEQIFPGVKAFVLGDGIEVVKTTPQGRDGAGV